MKILAHRGVSTEYPENTMAAFRVAAEQDYDGLSIETAFTKDNVCVVHADTTLNRTCRSAEGGELPEIIEISKITWEETQKYDTGYHKSYKFKGWKMHRLEEVLSFAKENNMAIKLDKNRLLEHTKEQRKIIEELTERIGVQVVDGKGFVETFGEIKPERKPLKLYDMHNHTHYSHDSNALTADLCDAAEANGLLGIAVTNHCDLVIHEKRDQILPIIESLKEVEEEQKKGRRLQILKGVEIGGHIRYPELTKRVIGACDYDVVLGSIHGIQSPLTSMYKDFSEYPDEALQEYYDTYLNEVYELVSDGDLDVLTHLTYPQRYIIGQYGRNLDTDSFYPKMDEIFKIMIQRGIALELNTSCVNAPYGLVMPYKEIVERYLQLGGRRLTLGSDSHWAAHCGSGFKIALRMLKELGVQELYYYKKRKPIAYKPEALR